MSKKAIIEPTDLKDTPGVKTKHTAMSFSDLLITTFQQESFLKSFVPILNIQSSVNAAIVGLKDAVVVPIHQAIGNLCKTVDKQNKIIEEQNTKIDQNKEKITKLQTSSTELSGTNLKLVKDVHELSVENEDLKLQLNYEQYGRRNSVRISNLKIHPSIRTEDEMIEIVTDFINGNVLVADPEDSDDDASSGLVSGPARSLAKLDPSSPSDIERSLCRPIEKADPCKILQVSWQTQNLHEKKKKKTI